MMPSLKINESVYIPDLIAYLDTFLQYKERKVNQNALKNYTFGLEPLRSFWQSGSHIHESKLSEQFFEGYAEWLKCDYVSSKGNSASEYKVWYAHKKARSFLHWLDGQGVFERTLVDFCPVWPEPITAKRWPTASDLSDVFDQIGGLEAMRNRAAFAVMADTGARVNEVLAIQIEDIHFDNPYSLLEPSNKHTGYIYLRETKRDNHGRVRPRWAVFGTSCGLLLKIHLRHISQEHGDLFALNYQSAHKWFKAAAKKSDNDWLHFHALRSAFIDTFARNNMTGGHMADLARRLQTGHTIGKGNAEDAYIDIRNKRSVLDIIRSFYVSIVDQFDIDWDAVGTHKAIIGDARREWILHFVNAAGGIENVKLQWIAETFDVPVTAIAQDINALTSAKLID